MADKVHGKTVAVDLDHKCQIGSAQIDVVYKHGRLYSQRVHLAGCQGAYVYRGF